MASASPVLARSRRDWLAVAAISTVSALAIGGAVISAPIRSAHVEHNSEVSGEVEISAMSQLPQTLSEVGRWQHQPWPGLYRPLVSNEVLILGEGTGVRAVAAETDTQLWRYWRDHDELCFAGSAWNKVVLTFRTSLGCGDVVALSSTAGDYAGTRSAINSDEVAVLNSNDRVGSLSKQRLELWRSDLVRTVEYGQVEAPQEPDMQPHPDCTFSSAATRTELVAATQHCPESATAELRLLKTTPEDSRKPEFFAQVPLDAPDAVVVAIAQHAAAVYSPPAAGQSDGEISTFSEDGTRTATFPVPAAAAVADQGAETGIFSPATADLPHHMTWFDGQRLYLFHPSSLEIHHRFDEALGLGTAVDGRLLLPVAEGIAVVNWDSGVTERIIAVDRQGYRGPVHLHRAGSVLVEARGDEIVGLAQR